MTGIPDPFKGVMKKDEIKFNQPHWTNPKSSSRKRSREELARNNHRSDRSEEYFDGQTKENDGKYKIFNPLLDEKRPNRPFISPPSDIIDNQITEVSGNTEVKNDPDSSGKKDDKMDEKRKRMSSFRREFSSMLEESVTEASYKDEVSVEESHSEDYIKINNPVLPQILSMLDESSNGDWFKEEEQEDSYLDNNDRKGDNPFDNEEYSILKDIVSSIGESPSSFKEHYHSQSGMIDRRQKELEQPIFDEISTMLEDSSSFEHFFVDEESSIEQEVSSSLLNMDEDLESCEDLFPWADEFEDMIECSSSYDRESSSSSGYLSKDEESSSCSSSVEVEDACDHEEHLCVVKVPVLLSSLIIDVDFMESLGSIEGLSDILNIEWSLRSLESKVVLPASTVFFEGVLKADIDYVSNGSTQTLKVPVKWEKVVDVNWIVQPDVPFSSQKEYTLGVHGIEQMSTHYEYCHQYVSPVEDQVEKVLFITHHEHGENGEISVQGNVKIAVDLLQEQYVQVGYFT